MDLNLMKDLRRKMTMEARIENIWSFFLDNFGESEEFMQLGGPMADENHPLLAVIAQAANSVFARNAIRVQIKDAIVLEACALISVPEHRIIHGSMMLEGYPASLLYLDDIQTGALCMFVRPSYSEHVRFSLSRAPHGTVRPN